MFTITYANGCRIWDVTERKLRDYIVTSDHDVEAVFEQATPVTKRIQKQLAQEFRAGMLKHATPAARRFIGV